MHIHLIAIGGTGMGALAGILKAAGHHVTGSDLTVYPPMSDYLRDLGIEVRNGYDAANLTPRPDLVIVGNAIRRDNPEARAAIDGGLEYTSFPGALYRFFLSTRTTAAVCGTHGKTTTTGLLAWLLTAAERDPSFLIGGIALNLGAPVRLGAGPHFVVEGDEYDTAFFDKVPKFVRYRPSHAILANVEFDHADIYPTMDDVMAAFGQLVAGIPAAGGLLVAGVDCPNVRALIASARCPITTYALDRDADFRAVDIEPHPDGTAFTVRRADGSSVRFQSPMLGRHNVKNALAAYVMAREFGLTDAEIASGLAGFKGLKRRQEERGEADGVVVVDDFAHHPTAVNVTLQALRERYGNRRLIVFFEPRTNTSRRAYFQNAYVESFDEANRVLIAPAFGAESLNESERMDTARLAGDIARRGVTAQACHDMDEVLETGLAALSPGDVAVLFSNGAFGGLHERLLAGLRQREAAR